jgi:hypothetical protein
MIISESFGTVYSRDLVLVELSECVVYGAGELHDGALPSCLDYHRAINSSHAKNTKIASQFLGKIHRKKPLLSEATGYI